MSATTNNDSFFIKGLGMKKETIIAPLVYDKEKWSGEKMILIPNLIQTELNRTLLVNSLAKPNRDRKYGIVALTASGRAAKYWEERGATIAKPSNIEECIKQLKAGQFAETIVFVNRYDGIDLPDETCRILIVDMKPFAQTILEQYQENCRTNSDLIDIRTAQKIEQGFGRGVRGEKDYCVIIIASLDLVANLRNKKLRKYFSPQTNKQVEIGLEVAQMAAAEATTDDPWKILTALVMQSLNRDEGWKEFYVDKMDEVESLPLNNGILEILDLEKKAENFYSEQRYEEAKNQFQKIIDEHLEPNNKAERG